MIKMSDDIFIRQITCARNLNDLCLVLMITCQIIRANAKQVINLTVAIFVTYCHLLI